MHLAAHLFLVLTLRPIVFATLGCRQKSHKETKFCDVFKKNYWYKDTGDSELGQR